MPPKSVPYTSQHALWTGAVGFDEFERIKAAFGAGAARDARPAALAPLPDLGDLTEGQPRLPAAPSLADRLRLDLGDLEPPDAFPEPAAAPGNPPDLSELSDAGGWVVVDRGEWDAGPKPPPWQKGGPPEKRKVRFGTVPVADLPDDVAVSGAVMSYDEALEFARELERAREVMES